MIVTFLDIVIAGLLLGGLYALIAMGLSLQYGVARVLNIGHGEFIMLGALSTWSLFTIFGINPLLCLIFTGPLAFILGFILHRTLFKRLLATSVSPAIFEGNSMLASFGLLFIEVPIKNLPRFSIGLCLLPFCLNTDKFVLVSKPEYIQLYIVLKEILPLDTVLAICSGDQVFFKCCSISLAISSLYFPLGLEFFLREI